MAFPLAALLPVIGKAADRVFDSLFPDTEAAAKAKAQFNSQIIAHAQEIEAAAADIIKQEAASKHWLAANWRPITMLVFVALIVARWLGYAAPGMAEAEVLALWDVVELGLGGYVVGRSVEKVAPVLADAMKRER